MTALWKPITLPAPVRGLSETWTPTDQPPLTTPATLNARAFDSGGRERASQRSGESKYLSAQISGSNWVQAICTVQKHEDRLGNFAIHAAAASVTVDWAARLHADAASTAGDNLTGIAVDPTSGEIHALAGDTGIIRLNDAGEQRYLQGIPLRLIDLVCKDVKLDGLGNAYVCVAGGGTDGVIHKFKITDTGYEKQWTLTAPNTGLFAAIAVTAEALYAIENVGAPNSYVHRFEGLDGDVPPQLAWSRTVAQPGSDLDVDPVGNLFAAFNYVAATPATPMTRKYNSAGDVQWTYNPANIGGHGYGVKWWNGYVYTVGPVLNGIGAWTDTKTLNRLIDGGGSVSVDWSLTSASAPETTYQNRSIDVDDGGGLWRTINSGGTTTNLQRITAAGAVSWSHATATNDLGEPDRIAIDPNYPPGEVIPQYVYLGGTKRSSDTKALFKVKVGAFASSITDSSPRTTVRLALCNGTLKSFTTAGTATPTNGSGALGTNKRFAGMIAAFRKVYLWDGDSDKVYDPTTDTVSTWRATSGRLPSWTKLKCLHGGRVWLAGDAANPQMWYASEFGDPDGWDFFPIDPVATQAIYGGDPRVGVCPDVVNCMISASEAVLIFGGDHSIHAMVNDPANGGGFEVVSETVGIAFGQYTACKHPDGRVFFFGSRGGVYVLSGRSVTRLRGKQDRPGSNSIDARLNAVNLTLNKIMLAWNDAEQTLHVFITPYSQGSTTHYVWDEKRQSWWMDQFPDAHGPTAIEVSDGDLPADRVLLMGGFDGQIRKWDATATTDDSTAITSYVVYGPLILAGLAREFLFSKMTAVVASATNSVNFEVYAAEDPDWANVGSASFVGTWADGRNDTVNGRARGHAVFVKVGRFGGGLSSGTWAVESIGAAAQAVGMVRNR